MKALWFSVLAGAAPARAQQAPTRRGDWAAAMAVRLADIGAAAFDRVTQVLVLQGHRLQSHCRLLYPIYRPTFRYTGTNFKCSPWGWDELQRVAAALPSTKRGYFQHP